MRCRLGARKLARYSKRFGIHFVIGLVRGNTNHRVDLFTADRKEYSTFPDGTLWEVVPGVPWELREVKKETE